MTFAHILPALMFVASAACLSPAPAQDVTPAANREVPARLVQLTGFVELYPEEGVQLLTGGRELTLIGETGLAVPHAGGEVLVTGRYVCDKVFRVEGVVRVQPRTIARHSTSR